MTQDLLPKFKFFQDIRIWPKNSDFDYEGWLENFSQDEQKIAQKILDFFVYFPDDIIDQMFSTVVGRAGYFFKKFDSTWSNESFSNNCWYGFFPGEDPNAADSGLVPVAGSPRCFGETHRRVWPWRKESGIMRCI